MTSPHRDILAQAAQQRAALVLAIPHSGQLIHRTSHFLLFDARGVWIESVPAEQSTIEKAISAGHRCGLVFKHDHKKVIGSAAPLGFVPLIELGITARGTALQLAEPDALQVVERRSHFRVAIPRYSDLTIRCWRLDLGVYLGDRPSATQRLSAVPIEMSATGMSLANDPNVGPVIEEQDRLRIEFAWKDQDPILIEGSVKRIDRGKAYPCQLGVVLRGTDRLIKGRPITSLLSQAVSEFQRYWLTNRSSGAPTPTVPGPMPEEQLSA